MRKMLIGTFLLLVVSIATAQEPNSATVISAYQIATFEKNLPHDRNVDQAIRVVDADGYHVGVAGVYRPKNAPPIAIVHQTKVTEVYYMLGGTGTLVTGGSLRPPTKSQKSGIGDWMDVTGAGIDGGTMRQVGKGDVVIIPGGMPHQWLNQESDISYIIIRPDPDKALSLK